MNIIQAHNQVVPLLAVADIVATATVTNYVNLTKASGMVEIDVVFGAIASTDSTGEAVVTIEANDVNDTSSSDNNEGAIAFDYQLTAAVGSDSIGAVAAATSAGVAVGQGDDNKILRVYVNPSVAAKKYVRAVITPTAEITSTIVGAHARFTPRHAQALPASST